jgi:signal transduction histidine kinase
VDLGLGGSVTAVARQLLHAFGASAVDFVIQDFETRRTMLWRVDRNDSGTSRRALHVKLDPAQQGAWLFDDPGTTWSAKKTADGLSVRVTQPGAWPLARGAMTLPQALVDARPFTTVAAGNMGLPEEWRGRVYLFDAAGGDHHLERSLHFLEQVTEHITPALTNVFLLRRLRSRAGAVERARVARELHDGTIQALFGIEMKIEALRRRMSATPSEIEGELADVQRLLQREVLALRELMQALRPIELETSDQLPDVLASLVERFRRDTGVSARFVCTGALVSLPSSTALELARIVQEALVNVRKHSRARNVLVSLTNSEETSTLIIEDDGQGFEFEGRLSARELEKRRIGPAIIKERARIAGAQLAVDSAPGVGARLELTFSNGVHA